MPSVQEDGNSMTIRAEDIIEILEREIRHLRCENEVDPICATAGAAS